VSIFNLLDQLESTIEGSKRAFMQNDKIIISPEELYQLIDQIRATVPDDIKDAQWVKKEEEQIKKKAQEDYERIIEEAHLRAQDLVCETEIYRLAEIRVKEMLDEANQAAHDITLGAFNYANDIMEKIEKQLQIYYDVVQDGKDEIQKSLEALNQE
jgi:vacuolar-type H+-ATPase subunit H